MRVLGLILAVLLAVGATTRVHASGFELYEESPAGAAMAGALTAVPLDASALFYNPAGIAARPGGSALLGVGLGFGNTTALLPASSAAAAISTDAKKQLFVLPEAYVAAHVSPRWSVGVGLFTQFGNGVRWNKYGGAPGASVSQDDAAMVPGRALFPGRFLATNTQIQTATLNPTVAFKVNDNFSVGAGIDVIFASVELQRAIQLGDVEASAHLGGSAQAVGANFGVLVQILDERLSFGFSYRSGMDIDLGLKAHFAAPPELQSTLVDQGAKTTLTLPHNFSFGVAGKPLPQLTIALDVHHSVWSDFRQIKATFESPPPGTQPLPPLAQRLDWRDSTSVRLGLQYVLLESLAVRLGFGYETTAVPTDTLLPTAPVSDRWLLTGGIGYTLPKGRLRGLGAGIGYIAGISADRAATVAEFPATYSQNVHLVSVALTYAWGGPGCCGRSCPACPDCGAKPSP